MFSGDADGDTTGEIIGDGVIAGCAAMPAGAADGDMDAIGDSDGIGCADATTLPALATTAAASTMPTNHRFTECLLIGLV